MTCKEIKDRIEKRFNIDITAKRSKHICSKLKFIYYLVCIKKTHETYDTISNEVGRKHCSVVHGLKRHDELLKSDKEYIRLWKECEYLFNLKERPQSFKNIKRKMYRKNSELLNTVFNDLIKLDETRLNDLYLNRMKPFLLMNKAS